jgi:antirestriction protein
LKGIPSFSTRTQKHIIVACLALHNFIRDNNLRDKESKRCDADEEYLVQETSGTTQTQGDESEDVENEDTMNTIRSRIADALVSTRGG